MADPKSLRRLGDRGSQKSRQQNGLGAPNLKSFKPVFTLKLLGGHVVVDWGWQGKRKFLSAIEIHVNRGEGCELLTIDTTAGYTDTQTLPVIPQKWTYKGHLPQRRRTRRPVERRGFNHHRRLTPVFRFPLRGSSQRAMTRV